MGRTISFDKLVFVVMLGHFCPDRCQRLDISPLVTLADVVMEMFEEGIPRLDRGIPWQTRLYSLPCLWVDCR